MSKNKCKDCEGTSVTPGPSVQEETTRNFYHCEAGVREKNKFEPSKVERRDDDK